MARVLHFGPFRLDLTDEVLWSGQDRVPLRPKTFAVLLHLAQHSRRLVTKDELLSDVWRGVTVDEELLRGYIRELRRLLCDHAQTPQFIETVARRGYRFLPEVIETDTSTAVREYQHGSLDLNSRQGPSSSGRPPIKVGILHSLTGMMAWTEAPVVDATMLAIDEINQRGGIHGRHIEAVVADGQSDEMVFAREAERLIATKNVSALFGCWTSASRKAVLPVVERRDHLLLYPVQYEGLEQSPNIVYTGAAPNQQIIPAIRWAYGFLNARRIFLVGWDSIYSWAAHEIIRDELESLGGEVLGEAYLRPDGVDVPKTVRHIKRVRPDLIINSTVGDINLLYSRVLHAAGITPQKIPTMYLSVSEIELLSMSTTQAAGDYAAWNYFQTVDRPENHSFISRFRARYGPQRVATDSMEASYIAVNVWAQAAEAAGSDQASAVRNAIRNQSFEAPEGRVRIDPDNQHAWKTVRLGQIVVGGQFEIIWSSEKPVRPDPFPASRSRQDWAAFVSRCYEGWGGRWTTPLIPGKYRSGGADF